MTQRAAILTIGTELAEGLATDTNGPELSRTLAAAGYEIACREIVPDDRAAVAARISAHLTDADLIVVTGGLGPTHDDITREAVSDALGVRLVPDPSLRVLLERVAARHQEPSASDQVMRQALVIEGAVVLQPTTGTAPGQLISADGASVLLLPGPPREMRPMLAEAIASIGAPCALPARTLRCARIAESDAQVRAERALRDVDGVSLTVLARPGLVDVVLIPRGADATTLEQAICAVTDALAPSCYSTDGRSIAEVVLERAASSGRTIAVAESCTGGLVAAELTAVTGASAVLLGGIIAYSDAVKTSLLGVREDTLARHGAVSGPTASEMAEGARRLTGADMAIAVTGIAGPTGGSDEKPTGTVWFGLAEAGGTTARHWVFSGDRHVVRARATVTALDLLRLALDFPDGGG